jgi:hypothetical protein
VWQFPDEQIVQGLLGLPVKILTQHKVKVTLLEMEQGDSSDF